VLAAGLSDRQFPGLATLQDNWALLKAPGTGLYRHHSDDARPGPASPAGLTSCAWSRTSLRLAWRGRLVVTVVKPAVPLPGAGLIGQLRDRDPAVVLEGELVMSGTIDGEPLAWAGSDRVIVPMPEAIDENNCAQVGSKLDLALIRGVRKVIADFTATRFCDSSGVRELLLAYKRAVDVDIEISAVIVSPNVQRVFTLAGLDDLMPVYESLAAALAASMAPDEPRLDQRDSPGRSIEPDWWS
jgi:anti-sigma B factor antagonist